MARNDRPNRLRTGAQQPLGAGIAGRNESQIPMLADSLSRIPATLNFNGKEVARITEEGALCITIHSDINLIEVINKKGQKVFMVDGEGNVSFAGKLQAMDLRSQKEVDEVLADREDKKTERFEDLIMEDE